MQLRSILEIQIHVQRGVNGTHSVTDGCRHVHVIHESHQTLSRDQTTLHCVESCMSQASPCSPTSPWSMWCTTTDTVFQQIPGRLPKEQPHEWKCLRNIFHFYQSFQHRCARYEIKSTNRMVMMEHCGVRLGQCLEGGVTA